MWNMFKQEPTRELKMEEYISEQTDLRYEELKRNASPYSAPELSWKQKAQNNQTSLFW